MTHTDGRRGRWPRFILIAAVVVLAGAVLVSVAALAGSKPVVGNSMAPTLENGDRILTDPFSSQPDRFDLVVVRLDGSAESVKRVIGMPGDAVEIVIGDDDEATIRIRPAGEAEWRYVDSDVLTGRWGDVPPGCCRSDGTASPADTGPQVVPAGRYFILGDNPRQSADSRRFGWIAEDAIVGVVRWRVWPVSGVGRPGGDFHLR